MPHFFVDDAFSDSKEVLAIPARHRLAAVGLWTLCGSWSASKLTDGFIPEEVLKKLGARPVLVDALVDAAQLWTRELGGIRFTNWSKWQRTREQVEAYRAAQAEKKRKQRSGAKGAATSADSKMSPGDTLGDKDSRPPGTPQTPIPTPTPTPSSNYRSEEEATDPYGHGISATPGADLVRTVVPKGHPPATLTSLRIQTSELLRQGAEPDVVRAALQLWCDKPGVGIGRTILSSLYSEAMKSRAAPRPNAHSGNGLNAGESKVAGWAALGQPPAPHLKAINE
ncbi:hypothetical protein OS122_02650 [Mycolicibacterium mucogenicum]|uniref:hypothetical protein n=1 Tax=Mycolicibacterium mucogenicum TaxID=56689 RepID=UPI00226A9E4B|nr:hypothetical protein [Mycolicibacterium mucogenicum]MCX8559799.1 hypothetical protein [Mycolicibacterium mucogenicum]